MLIRNPLDLGRLIREHRHTRGLTQAGLAAIVGVSRKWIIGFESGKRTTDLGLVLRTLNAVGLDVDVRARVVRPAHPARPGHPAHRAPDVNAIVAAASKARR